MARAERILSIRHFHTTFTLPSEQRKLAQSYPEAVYNAFFHIVGEILEELGRTQYGAQLGWTAVLHTWKRDLGYHPHIHVLVTAGGLSRDGATFRPIGDGYLFPGEVMGELLRGKMLDALRRMFAKAAFPELDGAAFGGMMAGLAAHKSWVVHVQPPFRDASHLLSYYVAHHIRATSDVTCIASPSPIRDCAR